MAKADVQHRFEEIANEQLRANPARFAAQQFSA
jgi:hypothetical protein